MPVMINCTDDADNIVYNDSRIVIGYFYASDVLPTQHGMLLAFKMDQGKGDFEFQICYNYAGLMYTRIKWGEWKKWRKISTQ